MAVAYRAFDRTRAGRADQGQAVGAILLKPSRIFLGGITRSLGLLVGLGERQGGKRNVSMCRIVSKPAFVHLPLMATKIIIKHPVSGLTKEGKVGFSWTYLFFGWLVPLVRGELGVAALHLLFSCVTFGFWQLIFAFLYNKQYMVRMIEKGYVLADSPDRNELARQKIGMIKAPAVVVA